ncbi:hypothetical protein D0T90_05730 [Neisseria animalis]|uniref:Uncharacterized protein n=2 Tax=Neisseria animalis TaxID=492 RepID=A0A5P3MTV4_NEIAN|nr:hypothetical protein D0T90_05730 [Neisseria animalis]ROW32702.1 hypothetical protein CGZ60_04070 [Neisseria animalis]
MLGAANEIGNCYKSRKKDKLYCLYFDYTARIFDARMSEAMNFPATEFFDDERFAERTISKVYLPRDVSMDEANQHLSELYGKLTQKISVKIYTSVQ